MAWLREIGFWLNGLDPNPCRFPLTLQGVALSKLQGSVVTQVTRPNADGTTGFQVNAGLRIRGGYSRSGSNPKHAFRFFFRRHGWNFDNRE